jgi:hypothetical protein
LGHFIFLGSIGAAIGVLFGPAPSSNHGENSWLGVAFGIASLFAGISGIIQAVLALTGAR